MYTHRYRFAAFDMDGTLLDSMRYWRNAAEDYLHAHGLHEEAVRLQDQLRKMGCISGLNFIREICEAAGIEPMTRDQLYESLEYHYTTDVLPKPGALAFLRELQQHKVPMCIVSATPRYLIEAALKHANMYDYFDFILSTDDYPRGKSDRAIFDDVCTRFGSKPEDTALVEDALYSIRTAKALGFYCIGIADPYAAHHETEIRALTDEFYSVYPF